MFITRNRDLLLKVIDKDIVQLLLETIKSIKDKYEDIRETFTSYLPKQTTVNQTSLLEKGVHLKSNRFKQSIENLGIQVDKVEEVK